MGITAASGVQHAEMFEITAATPAHDPGDAASRGPGAPETRMRGAS
ncbi:MAG: hypothetical protein OXP12_09425 [Thaumarchaeota archaeon]|nr:hypothetical protein [Nitrososphaerota archaeon]MDE0266281.1 hypothetical protein [Nitrososphaerota archaeon]MDE0526635.1 hypothetical protein [Nitrososphaerota archaeon]